MCYVTHPTLRGYHAAVRELSRSSRTVSEFIMEPVCRGIDPIHDFNIFNSPKDDFVILVMRNNLTSLEYTLDGYKLLHPSWDWNEVSKSLFRMTLSCAQALEHFALNTNVEPYRPRFLPGGPVPLLEILPMERWRVLRSFSLRSGILTLGDFVLFLSALPATITALEFHKVIFFDTTWETVLGYLRDVVGWGSDSHHPLPTLTVSLVEYSSLQTVILRDDLRRFFERKAPNPFTSRPGFVSHGSGIANDWVLPGYGHIVDDLGTIAE
ncbi:hypothetical protein AJ78_00565 [Emergomyces pasteurianus Ep9510]|uniref:Uncharacterized protein n=1 Tax=Emergomyces pasteurianus Ep9510 TaxID=1447872 RepID=A0A1J9PSU9_9EURO|nr:hypothetical protein AJ78_00565 [Emergomyces pasteurianus Ep9510]